MLATGPGGSSLSASDVLVHDSDDYWIGERYYVNVVLSNRDLISRETILFPSPKSKIDPDTNADFKILIRPSEDGKNLTLVYSSAKGERELFTEYVGTVNDSRIREIILLYDKNPKFMIVTVSALSQGATGDGSAYKELLFFSLNDEQIGRRHWPVKIEERWWTPYGSLEYNVGLTRLPGSSKYLLVLDSYEERITYVFDGTSAEISKQEGHMPRKIKPSFECSRSNTNIEKLICSDDALSSLDSLLSGIYEKIGDKESIRNYSCLRASLFEIRESISDFLTHNCLTVAYDSRIEFLLNQLNNN